MVWLSWSGASSVRRFVLTQRAFDRVLLLPLLSDGHVSVDAPALGRVQMGGEW